MRSDYSACKNQAAGKWEEIELVLKKSATAINQGAKGGSRRARGSKLRQALAKQAQLGQIIALSSTRDNQFPWWLAVVVKKVFNNNQSGKLRHGQAMKKGLYLDVKILDQIKSSAPCPVFNFFDKQNSI